MSIPYVEQVIGDGGHFRVFATSPSGVRVDITMLRGVPVTVASLSTTDPFTDATASINLPQVTGRDKPGQGDLWWWYPWSPIDIVWYNEEGSATDWVWEGFIVSEDIEEGCTLALKGALYRLDNYLAAPWFPQYPVPYELLIKNAFAKEGTNIAPLVIQWPDDWATVVPERNDPDYLWFLRPWGVRVGEKWTSLTTRNTGGWEPLLTGYVQSLLSVMYVEGGGQWTVEKRTGRIPVLKVRPHLHAPDGGTLEVHYGAPNVKVNVSRDFDASTNVIYGQGRDLQGTSFSGQQVSRDGQTTYYEPFASLPYVYPADNTNPRFNRNIVRKESRLQFPDGMSLIESRKMSAVHLQKFSDPGYVGSITLSSDPLRGGVPFNKMLIKAGMTILVKGLRGSDVLFHISETNGNPGDGSMTLTVDTKYRDALTVYEVRAKTRDALDPVRLLRAGQFSTTVQDTIMPWSYSQGSGIIPSAGAFDATDLFINKLGPMEKFPWTETTKKYPPKTYPQYYVKIGPKNANADRNWSGITRQGINYAAYPIRMSQSGTIRLTQIAAYDEDGNVMPVKFHVGIYANSGVNVTNMPMIPTAMADTYGYPASQRYPFYPGAFENINPDGTQTDNPGQLTAEGADMVVGFGNFYEGAGYFPGMMSAGGLPTGLLSEESPWTYDTTNSPNFDKYSVEKTRKDPTNGLLYLMIYCDSQGAQPVYFMGRLYRSEAN